MEKKTTKRKTKAPSGNGKAEKDRPIDEQLRAPGPVVILDPFDPESLRLSGVESLGVKKVLTVVPCSKPNKHNFVRVHPDATYHLETAIFEDKIQGENYLVAPDLWADLSLEVSPVLLFTAVTRHNDVFLWPVKLPGLDGRKNHWHESALAAAELAMKDWVRMSANMPAGRYDVAVATGSLPDPIWPTETFQDLLRRCFENRFIDSPDHVVAQKLRGEV